MKKLSKISLGQLYKNDMAAREMNMLRGGYTCGCGCVGTSSKKDNYYANIEKNIVTDDAIICNWSGDNATVYGGSTVPA